MGTGHDLTRRPIIIDMDNSQDEELDAILGELTDLRDEFEESVTTLRGASTQSRRNSGMSRGDDNGVEDIEPSSDHRLGSQHKLSCSWHLRPGSDMPWSSCRNATRLSPKVV